MADFNLHCYEALLREGLKDFDLFSSALIDGSATEFGSPFDDYQTWKGDILSYLHELFQKYLERVKRIDCLDNVNYTMIRNVSNFRAQNHIKGSVPEFDLYAETHSVCDMIIDCLVQYFKGFPAVAYERMEKTLTASMWDDDQTCHLMNLLPQIQKVRGSTRMYRVRKGSYSEAKDLFHVPFEKRKHCSTYRFSIAGLPALYCSSSLATAILETGINPNDGVTATVFTFKDNHNFNFVDLTIPRREDYGFWERYSMILFYPLIVACGLKVRDAEAPFKEEYIIPQLFYQVIRSHSNGFDGIIYNSTKHASRDIADARQRDFVIFTENCDVERGYCATLADRLQVAGPITFRYNTVADITDAETRLRAIAPVPLLI